MHHGDIKGKLPAAPRAGELGAVLCPLPTLRLGGSRDSWGWRESGRGQPMLTCPHATPVRGEGQVILLREQPGC